MKITLRHRDGSKKTWNVEANSLYGAIKEIITKTYEEDDTGYFFDVEDADERYLNREGVIQFDSGVGLDLRNVFIGE